MKENFQILIFIIGRRFDKVNRDHFQLSFSNLYFPLLGRRLPKDSSSVSHVCRVHNVITDNTGNNTLGLLRLC